jgi:dipeptidyl-peptidase-4
MRLLGWVFLGSIALCGSLATAQDDPQRTLTQMPRYDRYEKFRRDIEGAVDRGIDRVTWAEDSSSFGFSRKGKRYRFSLAGLSEVEDATAPVDSGGGRRGRQGGGVERGRQASTVTSADGKWKAISRDRNVYLTSGSAAEFAVTTDGSVASRVKYGVASWVYGEELEVREAMWFSPDSKKLAYYRFDESEVKDYFLGMHQLETYDTLDQEPYPKAGAPNPKVELYLYDLASRTPVKVDVTFDDPELAHYVFAVRWSKDGRELYFHRMNRKQNHWQWCAADRETGKCRVILNETRADAWVDQNPAVTFLKDGKRFIYRSDESGFHNLYLYDTTGKRLAQLTSHAFEVDRIEAVDEADGWVYYAARSADNPYLLQLHRVGLDGSGEIRLTDPSTGHTTYLSPDGKHFVDVAEDLATPPVTTLRDASGKAVKELSRADVTKAKTLGLKPVERFTFTAADGKTVCYGNLSYPSDFDPAKKYPLLVFVYGGPGSGGAPERYAVPNAIAELGFIVASMDGRNTNGRGRAFLTAGYRHLGQVEIDDHAAGVKALAAKYPFIDGKRVGIQGTSYGGYFSALSILRYPDVYAAACASSPVTDWRLYDSVYTERYMGLPSAEDNQKGYDEGSCMTYAKNLKGRLMLYFGTADNNVHPSNAIQLAEALERAGKRYDMMVGADRGHSQMNSSRMWEYFINYLILDVPKDALKLTFDARKRALKSKV